MKKNNLLFIFIIVGLLALNCTGPVFEIKGVVNDGLNGAVVENAEVVLKGTNHSTTTDKNGSFLLKVPTSDLNGITTQELNATVYLKKESDSPDLILVAGKSRYQPLEYRLTNKSTGLTLNLLPVPPRFNAKDYTGNHISFTNPLEEDVQWENIIDGVRRFYEKRIKTTKPERELYWDRDLSSPEAYNASVEPNRASFRSILGAIDEREPVSMEKIKKISETDDYIIYEVRWPVLKEVLPRPALQYWPELDVPRKIFGEGLMLVPKGTPKGYAIAVPDADQNPEDLTGLSLGTEENSQFARRLAENGFTVVVPVIIDRTTRWSRGTNRPSRSWIYSQAHEMGRTVAGYEVQKMEAVVDWFATQAGSAAKIGIAGYGEGGLLALYTAALDTRVDATLISGYFAPREEIWKEPIYRNIWGLLYEFGDAELASMIAPRSLVVEYSKGPDYTGELNEGKKIEPPGRLWTPYFDEIQSEFDRINTLVKPGFGTRKLIYKSTGARVPFGSEKAVNQFMKMLGHSRPVELSDEIPADNRKNFDPAARMGRMVEQMVGHTQLLLRDSEYVRKEFDGTIKDQEKLREFFKRELTGWVDDDFLPMNVRTKKFDDQPGYVCYDVLMDVLPDVELWGILCIPKDIEPGEKRPVIVLQHGRGGYPTTALGEGSGYYEVGRVLADRGFVVFTPFGNWTGETRFRWIDRIAKPSRTGLWSTVGRQHQQLIGWFKTLPFVDPSRIAIYGKSIGGQAASLVASMIPEYALSINCAYFNESARKESSIYYTTSFVYHVDSEMPMWNRGHTLEYAEMANRLIFPRPFMVEHGRQDGIALPEWVEHEYAKVKEHYERMGKGDLTVLDLHDGGHIINGDVSFPFLHKHLNWPEPQNQAYIP